MTTRTISTAKVGNGARAVYNQQATAYLLRDEPEAVVRAFYSYLASAFSHSFSSRWSIAGGRASPFVHQHRRYRFELYRNMLVREREDDVLVLGQATPRASLRDRKQYALERMPTYFGEVSARLESRAQSGEIRAEVRLAHRRPAALHVRFRHPNRELMQSVTVNGRPWRDFDAAGEWVRIRQPADEQRVITLRY